MHERVFPPRTCDGTVEKLLNTTSYQDHGVGIRYVESGRRVATAFRDRYGRDRVRVSSVSVEERLPNKNARGNDAWLIDHDGEGRELTLPQRYRRAIDQDGVVHYGAVAVSTTLCGRVCIRRALVDVANDVGVTCIGCLATESSLAWDANEGVWRGPYPDV